MAGHSHWAGIKHKKEITDKKRGAAFSKLLKAITAAAKTEPNPDFNPRLRTAVQKAKDNKVPAENIERAIKKASESGEAMDELLFEAYGPGGVAILMTAITDNRNRTVAEIKSILNKSGGKWAESGSVQWAFESPEPGSDEWKAKFPQDISDEDGAKLLSIIENLEDHDDIQKIFTNRK